MYHPYFFARRSELMALRDTIAVSSKIRPILEPVSSNPADLKRAVNLVAPAGAGVYLVENPSAGDFRAGSSVVTPWLADLAGEFALPGVRPTYLVTATTTATDVANFFARHPGRSTGLVLRSSAVPPSALVGAIPPAAKVFVHRSANPASYLRSLTTATAIEIVDSFIPEARNADYGAEEWFSSAHEEFVIASAFGFSDFTVISSAYRDSGGGPIGAMAIHLTFVDGSDNSIWIEHFVSDEVRTSVGDLHSKFLESLEKLEARIARDPGRFRATAGLAAYRSQFATGRTTSLAGNKRQEIAHHLELVAHSY